MKQLEDMLILHENLKLKPYRCTAGKLTIGVGRNLEQKGISRQEALMMLRNDIAEAQEALARSLPWFVSLDEVRRCVLIDMAINMGIGGLLAFKTTLGHIEGKRYPEAARQMLQSLWAKQVGTRAVRLSRMMESGKWPEMK